MKVDSDLRAAVKAAEKAQKSRDSYEFRSAAEKKSVASFLSRHPKIAAAITKARAENDRLSKRIQANNKTISDNGLEFRYSHSHGRKAAYVLQIADNDKFKKAGGTLEDIPERWRAEAVIGKLAMATPDQGAKILAGIGIIWS